MILRWRRPIQPEDGHSVLVWRLGEEPSGYDSDAIEVLEDGAWFVRAFGSDEHSCVAVAYLGTRLGTVWPMSPWPDQMVGEPDTACPPERTAALLRWMQVPLLHRCCRSAVTAFAQKHPACALSAWLLGKGLPETLEMPALSEEWLAVVRALFADWRPEASEANPVTRLFCAERPQETLMATVHNLLRVDPRLMDAVVSAWLERRRENGGTHLDFAEELRDVRLRLAGLETGDTEDVFRNRLNALLGDVALSMGVDTNFLEQGIVSRLLGKRQDSSLSETDGANLETALHVEPFRRYLGLCILREIEREI